MTPFFLYAGNVPMRQEYGKFTGLSLSISDERHIKHDIRDMHPFNDNSVYIYQAEDVFEHIEYHLLPAIINDIYRILVVGGIFRLSLPDYRCDILAERSLTDDSGNIFFDPGGGGNFKNGKVTGGGHLWFPFFETVMCLLSLSSFNDVRFYHYYNVLGEPVVNPIDYKIGYIQRTPDHDPRVSSPYRPMSIVVDCFK